MPQRGGCGTLRPSVSSARPSISQQLFRLSGPIIGINVLFVLMLAVDAAVCGRLPDSETALAALGFSTQLVFLLMVAMLGLLVGTVALVARAYGAGDRDRINHVLVQSTQLTALVGVVIGVVGAAAAAPLLRLLGASDAAVDVGVEYLRPLMLGTPFSYLAFLYAGVLRGVGNTRIPFLCALAANVVNFVLVYGLVLGKLGFPPLGVRGAAYGTVVAQLVNVSLLVTVLRRGMVKGLLLRLSARGLDRRLAVELYRIGWPAAVDNLIVNAGFLTALGMLGSIDEVTVAAHSLGLRVQSLAFVPGLAISQATAAMVGQALGAKDVPRARGVARASMLLCFLIMTGLAIPIVALAEPLVHAFGVDPGSTLEAYAVQWTQLLGAWMVPTGINVALVGLLQGSGATRTSLRINAYTIAIQVPLSWVLGFPLGLGAWGIWAAFPLAFLAKSVMCYGAYRGERWAVTGTRVGPAR